LRGIDFEGAEGADEQADQNSGAGDVALGVNGFFGKRRDGVEADVSEDGERGAGG
jgi:hypothetical protein